jgi:hypothetical protein
MEKLNLEPAVTSPAGTRYCSNCSQTRKSDGGFWKVCENRKNRRWLCKSCSEKKFK